MDSAHFRRLCFLLLTIAAPHANIAMPSGNPAGMTQASSSDKISVTVYYCKDCEINICKEFSSEGFDIIGETENKMFSKKPIELQINETNINICFQQENIYYKGIYGIWWQKNTGTGYLCGIADYGENRGGNIAKICCAAEINHEEPRSSLECYISSVRPPPWGLEDIVIMAAVLLLGAFAAAIMFRGRRNRNGQGFPMLIQQFFFAAGDKNLVPDTEEEIAPSLKKNSK